VLKLYNKVRNSIETSRNIKSFFLLAYLPHVNLLIRNAHLLGVFSCSHLIRELIVKLYHSFSNILYSPQVSLVQGSLLP
jgi:hypothetical protein